MKHAFTLLETVIVIAVITIVSAVIVQGITKSTEEAKKKTQKKIDNMNTSSIFTNFTINDTSSIKRLLDLFETTPHENNNKPINLLDKEEANDIILLSDQRR